MPLTDTMLRNLKSDGTPAKLADSEGLYLYLSASGGKLWRMDYRYAGKRKTLSFGAYPAVSLKDARRKRDKAKELLANDIDPGAQKKAAKEEAEAAAREQALTFAVVAQEWFATKQDSYAAANIKKKQWLISLLNERIGDKPISKLVPTDILGAIRPVEAAGHSVTAHKLAETAGQICRFARTCGYIVFNPADGLKEVLKPIQTKALRHHHRSRRCRPSPALHRRISGRSRCRLCTQDSALSGLAECRASRRTLV